MQTRATGNTVDALRAALSRQQLSPPMLFYLMVHASEACATRHLQRCSLEAGLCGVGFSLTHRHA